MKRIIAHLDMDAFFAAVEERDNPRIKDKPIVVGSDPMYGQGRGVVSTANYKAREYGIRSALPISKAWQFSQEAKAQGKPEAVFLDVDFRKYEKASAEIMQIIQKYSPLIEQASIDEAYFDLSHLKNFAKAREICQEIKKEIKNKQKLTASVGLGPNKLIAKIASDMQKPDGLTVVLPEEAEIFLEPLTVRKIPGIGPQTEKIFNQMGIKTVKELKKIHLSELSSLLGKWGVKPRGGQVYSGEKESRENINLIKKQKRGHAPLRGMDLYHKIRGRDESPLVEEYEVKSVGEQETFSQDTLDFKIIFARLNDLCADVFRRFQESGFKKFKTIVITVRFSGFETKTKSHTITKEKGDLKTLKNEVLKLIFPFLDRRQNPQKKLIRLIGVRIEKLS